MSGVYVMNMDMPKGCYFDEPPWHCPFYDCLKCMRLNKYAPARTGVRLLDCPLIPLENHGKLIDADKLIARLEEQRTVILHELPEAHAREDGYTKEDYIFERNGDMLSMLRNQAGVIPADVGASSQ